jgi:phage terminase Nu1 subunit (DNA packaging protein)
MAKVRDEVMPVELPLRDIAQLLGVTYNRIHNLNYTPSGGDKRRPLYNVAETIRRYIDDIQKSDEERDIEAERLRLTKEQANLKEIERKQLEFELVHIDDVETIYTEHVLAAKRALLSIPTRYAAKLCSITTTKEMIIELEGIIDNALGELSTDEVEYQRASEKRIKKKLATPAKTENQPVVKSKLKTKQ